MHSLVRFTLRTQVRDADISDELLRFDTDAHDLPLQLDSRRRLDPLAHALTECFYIMGGGVAGIDQEVAMHLGHLGAADCQAAAARRIDQLPGAVARRVLKGRDAGHLANRLRGLAMRLLLGHARPDHLSRRGYSAEASGYEDQCRIEAVRAIGVLLAGIVDAMAVALPVQRRRLDQDVLGLAAIGASVHPQRAAD